MKIHVNDSLLGKTHISTEMLQRQVCPVIEHLEESNGGEICRQEVEKGILSTRGKAVCEAGYCINVDIEFNTSSLASIKTSSKLYYSR